MSNINTYNSIIFKLYSNLIENKNELNNYSLAKIFEYYSCIQLSNEYNQNFFIYDDIPPDYKNKNAMPIIDIGIDGCNMNDAIVQCKLRSNNLSFREISTFIANMNSYDEEKDEIYIRWKKLYLTRNECDLSRNIDTYKKLYIDKCYEKEQLIEYCNNILANKDIYLQIEAEKKIELYYYQNEAIEVIKKENNCCINVPTGGGKNLIMINCFEKNKKYLLLVPRRILAEQFKNELIKFKPELKSKLQCIGDGNNKYNSNKLITICVYNSIDLIEDFTIFDKIFIDEAHHIKKPIIYMEDDGDKVATNTDEEAIEDGDKVATDTDSEDEDYYDDESYEESDNEDELHNIKSYTTTIRELSKYNNNVYMSATIDEIKGWNYYNKDIRELIDNNYLCDYDIHIPVFSQNNNERICKYLIEKYHSIIIYCNSQKDGKKINDIMNNIMNGCCKYIDCKTSKIQRKNILDNFSNGKLKFIVNVRVLIEGFSAPICNGVCLLHMPTNKTNLIQIIGRSLRKHNDKSLSHIIFPCIKDEEEIVSKFVSIISDNDSKLKKAIQNKKINGYIRFNGNIEDNDEYDSELICNNIYNSFTEIQNKYIDNWLNKLNQVKEYIDKTGKKPSRKSKNYNENKLNRWFYYNKYQYHKFINGNKKCNIFNNNIIYNKYCSFINQYKKFILSYEELFISNLNEYINFININNKIPSSSSKNIEEKRLGNWYIYYKANYKKYQKDNNTGEALKNHKLRNLFEDLTNKYKAYLLNEEEIWLNNFDLLIKFKVLNNKYPSIYKTDIEEKKLATWFINTKQYYKKYKDSKSKGIYYKSDNIRNIFEEFIYKNNITI